MPAEAAGYLISILAVGMLLGPVLATAPVMALAVRFVVGAYLILLAIKLWQQGRAVTLLGDRPVTRTQVFVTTLLNPKALMFALGVVPFGAQRVWPYLLGFVLLLLTVAMAWIKAGVILGRVAAVHGHGHVIVRASACAVGAFALLIVIGPLLR
jgi:threonine/homoserine/homoserine lactone efflux protein